MKKLKPFPRACLKNSFFFFFNINYDWCSLNIEFYIVENGVILKRAFLTNFTKGSDKDTTPHSFEISSMLNVAINKILFRFLDLRNLKICLQLSFGCRKKP